MAARFRAEAETSARFQHPNLIQVYEVGESEGEGYLALEYAGGGNLRERLDGKPQTPRVAAELAETLSLAVHHAHQHGIVHRDLKPSNVVLTEEGVPKIVDFGLAKLLDAEAGMTQTGTILGTPSYMAPEQARSSPGGVTILTDVYALGAILYEVLTGRPPFQGTTPLSVLEQVSLLEPTPPGRLQRRPAARPGDDLSEVPGEGAEEAVYLGAGAGRGPPSVPRRPADHGEAPERPGAAVEMESA